MRRKLVNWDAVAALVVLTVAGTAVFFVVFDLILATLSRAG